MRTLIFLVMLFPAYAYAGWDFFGHQEILDNPPKNVIKTSETNDDCLNGVCPVPKIVDKVPEVLKDRLVVPTQVITKNLKQKIGNRIKKPFQRIFQRKFLRCG